MRLKMHGTVINRVRKLCQELYHLKILGGRKAGQVVRSRFFRSYESLLGGVLKNTADAGMGILDIIDRIFVGLLFGQVNVEYQLGIRFAHQKKEAGGITSDLINQVAQGDI